MTKTDTSKTKVAFFSDSRGWHKADPKQSLFWEDLAKEYDLTSFAQPYKWATILDFISLVRDGVIVPSDYDAIVLWGGVVDFSPRPEGSCVNDLLMGKNANQVTVNRDRRTFYNRRINNKLSIIQRMLTNTFLGEETPKSAIQAVTPRKHEVSYAGEMTASLYTTDFLTDIAAELNAIENLIFIDTCGIHPDWDGDFLKGRPRNINVISEYNEILVSQLKCPVIPVSDWTGDLLKKYTVDSIHVTQEGSDEILRQLRNTLGRAIAQPVHSNGNFVLTATDANFFASTLILIESIFEQSTGSVDGTVVLDIGMTASQRGLLEGLRNVHVVDYLEKDLAGLKALPFDFFEPQTYGFKAYLTVKAPELLADKLGLKPPFNLMYIDGGIFLNRDIGEIFSEIGSEGIFCVDHNDCHDLYGDAPFFLLNVLSPKLFDEGFERLTNERLCKPYIKAGFFGYRVGGPWQHLMDEYWKLCLETSVLALPKPVTDKLERMWYRNNTDVAKYAISVYGSDVKPHCFDYSNGRQDQTALSYLVAKHDVTINNSRAFNFTVSTNLNEKSWKTIAERLAKKHPEVDIDFDAFWESRNVGRKRQTKASLLPMPNVARSSLTTLHRGALAESDHVKYTGQLLNRARNINNDTFILLGNGPSLGDVDLPSLAKYKTMGLNAAYRAYERMGFWPNYFGCFDALVCGYHSDRFKDLVKDSDIERFFFINYNEQKRPIFPEEEIQNSPKFQSIKFLERTVPEKERDDIISVSFDPFVDMLTSGSNSIQCALLMGFRKIILLGCDANYTEVIDGAKQETSNKNRIFMEKTPEKNTNYWFDDYQQEGDRFNLPNTAGCQLPAWDRLSDTIQQLNINAEIINCSPISKIDVFKKMPLEDALKYFDSVDVSQIEERKAVERRSFQSLASDTYNFGTSVPMSVAAAPRGPVMDPTIASSLLLDPAAMLPRIEKGGDLAGHVEKLFAEGGPTAEHLSKVRDWARAQVRKSQAAA